MWKFAVLAIAGRGLALEASVWKFAVLAIAGIRI